MTKKTLIGTILFFITVASSAQTSIDRILADIDQDFRELGYT